MISVTLALGSVSLLAWRPFLDPLPLHGHWMWLLLPLVVVIAVVYKAIRVDDLSRLPRQVAIMVGQIAVVLIALALLLWLITEVW